MVGLRVRVSIFSISVGNIIGSALERGICPVGMGSGMCGLTRFWLEARAGGPTVSRLGLGSMGVGSGRGGLSILCLRGKSKRANSK